MALSLYASKLVSPRLENVKDILPRLLAQSSWLEAYRDKRGTYTETEGSDKCQNPLFCVSVYLLFRAASSQVSSARVSLTAVFGMGTGVPSPSSTLTLVGSGYPPLLYKDPWAFAPHPDLQN